MKNLKLASLVALSVALGAGSAFAQDKAEAPSDAVVKFASEIGNKVGADAKVQDAIKAATAKHKKFSYDDQVVTDSQWRVAKSGAEKEKKAAGKLKELAPDQDIAAHTKAGEALIKASLENDVSKYLTEQMKAAKGAVTEIVVTDGWGWNVAQTGGTSDYFQGDEPKWQKPFAGETDIGPVEDDGGVKVTQISVPVKQGDKIIGAVTVGVDVSKVK